VRPSRANSNWARGLPSTMPLRGSLSMGLGRADLLPLTNELPPSLDAPTPAALPNGNRNSENLKVGEVHLVVEKYGGGDKQ
jgi:hypothetical protein